MGPTGAGKSTFINKVFDCEKASVDTGPDSHTRVVASYHLPDSEFPNNRIFLVDTPGFDDSTLPPSEVVRHISIWLANSYSARMKVAGVIYCYNIMDTRWSGSAQENFKLFEMLCGPAAVRKTVIVTTRWNVPKDIAPLEKMEDKLKKTHWKSIITDGAAVHRDKDGYRDTIDYLLVKNAYYDPLQIQEELVDRNKSVYESGVANMLFIQLQQSLERHKEKVTKLKESGGPQDAIDIAEAEVKANAEALKKFAVTLPRKIILLLASFS
ncbi:hypothetical protein DXG01_002708 [Tephrocybe rancida]|nr:hypothetical protein DXG01_002708 [Tephrocybe rancida]